MSDKQMAIDEVGKAFEFISAGNEFAAIEHAEEAKKLDPSVKGAYDATELVNDFETPARIN